jgi:D-galactarolactone cycloisomerase
MLELDTAENPFREELVVKPLAIDKGYIHVPTGPGLGIEVDEEVVKKYLSKG